jgi:outer membrane immunogenic protein
MIRTAILAAALLLSNAAANAADLHVPVTPEPIYEAAGFDWNGLYVGVHGGGEQYRLASFAAIGGVVGFNFLPTDSLLLGVEATADYTWNNAGNGVDLFANARAGWLVTDPVLIYALAGVGTFTSGGNSVNLYQLGGGVEFAVTDQVTVRGQLTGEGNFGGTRLFNAARATVGAAFHF